MVGGVFAILVLYCLFACSGGCGEKRGGGYASLTRNLACHT
jgi:hypothetical protein